MSVSRRRQDWGEVVARRTPPEAFFVISAIFHYLGPAFAVLLFARVDVLGVMWFRIAAAAAIFALWRRPWRVFARLDPTSRLWIVAWGVLLTAMNTAFYLAIARLPLATVAAIEFVPVIVLAAIGIRSIRNGLALLLAVTGVFLLTELVVAVEPLGLAFAFANAALFAGYIVIAHRVAEGGAAVGVEGLGAAMLIAAVVATPIGGWQAASSFDDPIAVLAGIGIGLSSSVIPYVTDQLAMARLPRATYALLVALLPATAAVIGALVLAQLPTLREAVGIALVVAAVAIRSESPSGE
jgi:inner membrane transporter RhtA